MKILKAFFRSFIANKAYNSKTGLWEYGFYHDHLKEGYPYNISKEKIDNHDIQYYDLFENRWICHDLYPMQKFYNYYLKIFS
jgi:hypothetical protein